MKLTDLANFVTQLVEKVVSELALTANVGISSVRHVVTLLQTLTVYPVDS